MTDTHTPFKDQIALVTGASRGIGAATAMELARLGAHVILVARTVGGMEAVDDQIQEAGGSCTLVPLDLTKHDMIDQLGSTIYQRWGKLDILVGNAAMLGEITPLTHATPKVWQQVLDVNLTANYRLLRSLEPLLRQSGHGRALFVTSGAAHADMPYWGAYSTSKAGLEAMVKTYAKEVVNQPIHAELFDPGIIRTAMRAQAFPGENPDALPAPEAAAERLVTQLLNM